MSHRPIPPIEDAHERDALPEHLRVIHGPPRKRRRIDCADIIIWGGWALALIELAIIWALLIWLR